MKVIKQNGNKGKNQTWTPHSQSRAPSRASPCLSEGLKVGRELDSDCPWTWLSRTWWNERPVRQMLEWFPESTAKHHCTKMLCSVSGPPPLGICRITQCSRLWTDGTHVASGLDQWPAGVRSPVFFPSCENWWHPRGRSHGLWGWQPGTEPPENLQWRWRVKTKPLFC